MVSYAEEYEQNPAFRAFVDARIGQAVVRLASLEVEHVRDQDAIAHLSARVKELEAQIEGGAKRSRRGENRQFS